MTVPQVPGSMLAAGAPRVRPVARGPIGVLVVRATQMALEFLCGLAVARAFGASAFGAYAVGTATAMLLAIPAALGFDRLLIREVAVYAEQRRWGLLTGLLARSAVVSVAAGTTLAVVGVVVLQLYGGGARADVVAALQLAALLVPLVAYARVRQAALQGLGRVVLGQVPEAVAMPLAMLALVAATWLGALPVPPTGAGALALQCAAAGVACVLGIVLLRRSVPADARAAQNEFRDRDWLRAALPFTWMLGFNAILSNGDTILVGWLLAPADAGAYRVASQMAMLVAFPLTAANMSIAPEIASAYARGDRERMRARARFAARLGLGCGLAVYAGLVALGHTVLAAFGPEFPAAYPALLILGAGYLATTVAGAAGYLLIMTRHARAAAAAFGGAAALQAGAVLLLAPHWGLTGAATGTSLALLLLATAFVVLVRRRLGIDATIAATGGAPTRADGDRQ